MKKWMLSQLILILALPAGALAGDYVVSPKGDDANPGTLEKPWKTPQKAAEVLAPGDRVLIRGGTYAGPVRPSRSGRQGSPVVYQAFENEKPVLDGSSAKMGDWGGVFHLEGRAWIEVRGLTVQHAGPGRGNAGILVQGCENILIQGNRTYDTASSGIGIWRSKSVTILDNEVELACNDGSQECLTVAGTDGFEVRGNHVHHGGPGTHGAEGIDAKDGSSHGIIHQNLVHDLNRLGIYVDAWDKPTHDIEVYDNVVHDCQSNGMAVASEAGGLLENVRLHHNLVYHNKHVGLTVGSWGEPVPHHPIKNILIDHNTFADNGFQPWGGGLQLDNAEAVSVEIRDNIVAGNLTFQINLSLGPKDARVVHNFIQGSPGEGEFRGEKVQEGDPLFKDRKAGDYRLLPGSPAQGLGYEQ